MTEKPSKDRITVRDAINADRDGQPSKGIADILDADIDLSDIPEATKDDFKKMRRRPSLTMPVTDEGTTNPKHLNLDTTRDE